MFSLMLPALAPALLSSQGAVLVVDAAGGLGWDFTRLDVALAVARDGDVVLVRTGAYGQATNDLLALDGKGVLTVAERGASVSVSNALVQNLPAASACLIQGLDFVSNTPVALFADDAGPVWIERSLFQPQPSPNGSDGPVVRACAGLVLAASEAHSTPIFGGFQALTATDSRLHLHDSRVLAETVGATLGQPLQAFIATRTSIELFGAEVRGAEGGDGSPFAPNGGNGGDALVLGASSVARVLDSVVAGGSGGTPWGSGTPGLPGQDVVLNGGVRVSLAGTARRLALRSPMRENEALELTLRGQPGDLAWIFHAPRPALGRAVMGLRGEFLLPATARSLPVQVVPACGVLQLSLAVPPLPAGAESAAYFAQAIVRDGATGRFLVSSPSAVVALDEGL